MFDIFFTEKIVDGSNVIKKRNKVSVSQDYLEKIGDSNHCEIACTGDTSNGFCVYIQEYPTISANKTNYNKIHRIIEKKCGRTRSEDTTRYDNALKCVHNLARAINIAYINSENVFDVDRWLRENNYA